MVKPVSQLKTATALLFVAPIALLTACSPNEPIATQPGTTPPIWTGSPDPSAEAAPQNEEVTVEKKTINAVITGVDGQQLAAATIDFSEKFATVTVQTTGAGKLAPGLHTLALTSAGKCEPASVGPAGGNPGDFLSAGDPIGAPAGQPGPLVPLQIRGDGTGMLVTTTDAFKEDELLDGDKSAIVIYDKSETAAADAAGGVAAKRVACGVLSSG